MVTLSVQAFFHKWGIQFPIYITSAEVGNFSIIYHFTVLVKLSLWIFVLFYTPKVTPNISGLCNSKRDEGPILTIAGAVPAWAERSSSSS